MSDETIKQLEFRILLNKTQKKTKDWEQTIMSPEILAGIGEFFGSKIGQLWFKSPEGQDYLKWQSS